LGALARTNARARQETEDGAGRSAAAGATAPIATPIDGVQELPSTVKVTPQCSCASTVSASRARNAAFVRREGASAGAASIAATLALFIVTYGIVFWFGIYYINRLINGGPDSPMAKEATSFANKPLARAGEASTGR
jgi:hypothetical protein